MKPEWKGRPSKIFDLPLIILLIGVTAGLVLIHILTVFHPIALVYGFCVLWLLYEIWGKPSPNYSIQDGNLIVQTGVFRQKEEYMELFRIKDISTSSNWFLNLLKIGDIRLYTTDYTTKEVELKGIKNYLNVANFIRKAALEAKKQNNVQEIDVE